MRALSYFDHFARQRPPLDRIDAPIPSKGSALTRLIRAGIDAHQRASFEREFEAALLRVHEIPPAAFAFSRSEEV